MACIIKPVLGSSCLPVWLAGMGTGLLQKLEEAWRKSCYPKPWPVCMCISISRAVSAVMEECELQAIKGRSIGMKTRDCKFLVSSMLSRNCLDNSLHLPLSRRM